MKKIKIAAASHKLPDGKAPEIIKIIKKGMFHYKNDIVKINNKYISALMANYQKQGTNIPIDINHAYLQEHFQQA